MRLMNLHAQPSKTASRQKTLCRARAAHRYRLKHRAASGVSPCRRKTRVRKCSTNENPSGLGNFKNNNRFDGMYYDEETGTLHNGYRTLSASEGRYLQSDPVGLASGPATYAYVSGSPLTRTDRFGLFDGTNFLPQVAQACTKAGTTVVTGLASVLGAAAFALTPGDAGACSTIEKPDSCFDNCDKILAEIYRAMNMLEKRINDMLVDKCNMFNLARSVANPNLPEGCRTTTWDGHIRAAEGWQQRLRSLIQKAQSQGCIVPADAWVLATRPLPGAPRGWAANAN
jgi:RHS repeat-associated protein